MTAAALPPGIIIAARGARRGSVTGAFLHIIDRGG